MARLRYPPNPPGVLDLDGGSSVEPGTKVAKVRSEEAFEERAAVRQGARDLDGAVEAMPGLSRQRKDCERAMPRDLTAEPPHSVMDRQLPIPDSVRGGLSSRQRKARSATKRRVQDRLPKTQKDATRRLISDPDRWEQLNDALSAEAGDVQHLDDFQRLLVQRVDRAVQAYERVNDRGHVVYSNVELSAGINSSNVEAFLRNQLPAGTVVAFDRFTAGAHTMHEIERDGPAAGRTVVLEMQSRRGMYLGRSDSVDDTAHLLPRGMQLQVVGTHQARYRRPDGTFGRRHVIQLVDHEPQSGQ
jgi:hypothetical protein